MQVGWIEAMAADKQLPEENLHPSLDLQETSRSLSEGEAVEGLYNGSIGQTDWYPAKISKVNTEGKLLRLM